MSTIKISIVCDVTGNRLLHFIYTNDVIDGLRTLDFPNLTNKNVNEIASNAFSNDSTLQRIVLPKTLVTIEQSAFENSTDLQIVEIEASEEIKKSSLYIQYRAFKNCTKLHTVILTTQEESDRRHVNIEAEAFSGCYNLRTIQITGECNISDSAFDGCDKDKLCFVCKKNSSVEKYAREHGYRYINV